MYPFFCIAQDGEGVPSADSQSTMDGNSGFMYQEGSNHSAEVRQGVGGTAAGNVVGIDQYGFANAAEVEQAREGETAYLNQAFLLQEGSGKFAEIIQTGSGNSMTIIQD
jgi:hypothetical protein